MSLLPTDVQIHGFPGHAEEMRKMARTKTCEEGTKIKFLL